MPPLIVKILIAVMNMRFVSWDQACICRIKQDNMVPAPTYLNYASADDGYNDRQ
jgi:hypothetical protein